LLAQGNTFSPNVLAIDTENFFIYGSWRTIATIGLKNTVVVDTNDALLICPTDRTQEVKTIRNTTNRLQPGVSLIKV
jgi:mannose-1-phosphate guanylyltransferase